MRAFAGLGLLLFLVILLYWMSVYAGGGDDEGYPIAMAFAEPAGEEIEMHVVVGILMANKDRIREDSFKLQSWTEWIRDHFILQDSAGNTIDLERRNNSTVIDQRDIKGTQEFFMVARLKPGEDYTFEYIPERNGDERFRYEFTAPAGAEKLRYRTFEPVD